MNKLYRLYNTIRYLKFKQVYFRIFYFVRAKVRKFTTFEYKALRSSSSDLNLITSIEPLKSYSNSEFNFLNSAIHFNDNIDWNYPNYGKLWTYNLSYFDFLHQKEMSENEGVALIHDFIKNDKLLKDAKEPFPISLRGINWIKFLSIYNVKDVDIDNLLYTHYYILLDNLEYHLLGNHLLENAFSLLFGAYYFQDDTLLQKAREILFIELDEQILNDGAHFELSPMYHQIMLFRVLDCINLVENNLEQKDKDLLDFLKLKASLMLGWLKTMTFKNGSIPLFNDSTNSIAPSSNELFKYAARLSLHVKDIKLKESGYRKFINRSYECILDIGHIGPDYIPGHAHSDTFTFELYIDKKPFIVDTGLSTYETSDRRSLERSTSSHNTVEIENLEQSEIWGGFRVANRAYVINIDENTNNIKATHNGYKKSLNALHTREFKFEEDIIEIIDNVISTNEYKAISRMHFHPDIDVETIYKHIELENEIFEIKNYMYAPEFNLYKEAKMIEFPFKKRVSIKIKI